MNGIVKDVGDPAQDVDILELAVGQRDCDSLPVCLNTDGRVATGLILQTDDRFDPVVLRP